MIMKYWVAVCINDSKAYNVRAKTKKEVLETLENYDSSDFEAPKKVEVEVDSAFDLLKMCLGEGGAYWEDN
jgi:hypothetical protein